VVKPRFMSRGLCTCGWAEKPRLLLSSATIDALIHAARRDCVPAIPLIQIGVVMTIERRGILDDCPRSAVASFLRLSSGQASRGPALVQQSSWPPGDISRPTLFSVNKQRLLG
jgi:hypothetical protein